MEKQKCPRCGGSGKVLDDRDVGAYMKRCRRKTTAKQRDIAKALDLSIASISDLEHGRKEWTYDLRVQYLKALSPVRFRKKH